jgi:dolichol kinase
MVYGSLNASPANALFLLAWADVPTASMVALVSLGWGDPAAAIIGRRFGRTRFANGRSVEGTAAFIAAAGVASFVALWLGFPQVPAGLALGMAAAGAVAGAVAELVSRRVDDNFSIPVSAAVAAAVVGLAVG